MMKAGSAGGGGIGLGPQALTSMQSELRMLEREPPPGVSAWPKDENRIHELEAVIQGPPDTLNMPPKGAWKPSLNIPTVLSTIRLLLEHPNPDDGLMTDITHEYKHRREVFDAKARESVRAHATSR